MIRGGEKPVREEKHPLGEGVGGGGGGGKNFEEKKRRLPTKGEGPRERNRGTESSDPT